MLPLYIVYEIEESENWKMFFSKSLADEYLTSRADTHKMARVEIL